MKQNLTFILLRCPVMDMANKFVIDRQGRIRALPKTRTKIELIETGGGINDFEFGIHDETDIQHWVYSSELCQLVNFVVLSKVRRELTIYTSNNSNSRGGNS